MSTIVQGTTPTITLLVPGVDLTNQSRVEVYIASTKTTLVFTGRRVGIAASEEGTLLFITPTQRETMSLESGKTADVQVRWIDSQGHADATDVSGKLNVERILYKHEISAEE